MTDPSKLLEKAWADIDATMRDVNQWTAQIRLDAEAINQKTRDGIDEVANMPVNAMLTTPLPMLLRPIWVTADLYHVDWFNVLRVSRFTPKRLASFALCTEHGADEPGSDCVISMLRNDCVEIWEQKNVPWSLYPHRLWLWRDRLWRAIPHNAFPSLCEAWWWLRCHGKCI